MVLKIYWKSYFEYLIVENILKDTMGDSGAVLGVKLKIEGHSKIKDPFNLFILLSIKKQAWNIALDEVERVMEAQFLWEYLQSQRKVILLS